ncbi:MAG: peptide chain release factor 1 [Armatimonadota bacterium]
MIDTLDAIERRLNDLSRQMSDPEIASDHTRVLILAKEHAHLEPIKNAYDDLRKMRQELRDSREMASDTSADPELREMASLEIAALEEQEEALNQQIRLMLLPKDPNDDKDVFVEVRGGTGGDEAALFAGDLLRMYIRFAERRGWKAELMSATEGTAGGYKEAVLSIQGAGAFSLLKWESGVHRVQRVPATEASGRIHTSAATVAVLPEAEDVEIEIDTKDLQVDTYRASSAGGQHVNKTDSAIRITHLPTGVIVTCQDERSQFQNKEKAMRMLRARLLEAKQNEQDAAQANTRKLQVGSGDRSEKIRTYNFPQGRVTDHRIGVTIYALDQYLDGDIEDMLNSLIRHDQTQRLEDNSNN